MSPEIDWWNQRVDVAYLKQEFFDDYGSSATEYVRAYWFREVREVDLVSIACYVYAVKKQLIR